MPIYSGDDRRRLIPLSLYRCSPVSSMRQAKTLARASGAAGVRTRICKLYGIPDPAGPANAVAVMQQLEEEDGIPQDY